MDFLRTVLLWTNKSFDPIVDKTLIMYHVISSELFFVEIFMMMEYHNQGIVNYMEFFLKNDLWRNWLFHLTQCTHICWDVMDNLDDDKIPRFSKNGKFIDFKVNFFSG